MHVFPQPIHMGAGQSERQLQELLGKLKGPNACVQPGPWGEDKSHRSALALQRAASTCPQAFREVSDLRI